MTRFLVGVHVLIQGQGFMQIETFVEVPEEEQIDQKSMLSWMNGL